MSYWKERSVLVTGCTGFVGGWLAQRLVDAGASVVGLIWEDGAPSHFYRSGLHTSVECVPGDIRDQSLLERMLRENPVDVVFHLAAQALVTRAHDDPLETFEVNTMGTCRLLEAVRKTCPSAHVVVATSDKVYGEHEELPYRETTPLRANNPYDTSKACADLIVQNYARSFGLAAAIVRCGNIYGGGDLSFDRLVPGTIKAFLAGQPVKLRSNGTFTRDYLYVEDAVSAYLAVARALDTSTAYGEAFNFGNEVQVSVLEMVRRIAALMGKEDLAPVILNTAVGEIPHQSLSSEKARAWLQWAPQYDLDNGLRATIAWYDRFFQENKPLV